MNSQRRERKDQHIENYLRTRSGENTLFEDVYIEHYAISDVSLDDIDTSIEFMGKTISMPLMIDAMTGGGSSSESINEDLSSICESLNIPMAVGSESIALTDESSRESFELVKAKKDLFRVGNLGFERDTLEEITFNSKKMLHCHWKVCRYWQGVSNE